MRSLRLLLLVMMLAFLPLPGWAGALAHAVDTIGHGLVTSATAPAASAADDVPGDAVQAVPTVRGDYPAFYASVARALRDGGPMPVDPEDAVAGLRIIEAAQRSAATGSVIRLTPNADV